MSDNKTTEALKDIVDKSIQGRKNGTNSSSWLFAILAVEQRYKKIEKAAYFALKYAHSEKNCRCEVCHELKEALDFDPLK